MCTDCVPKFEKFVYKYFELPEGTDIQVKRPVSEKNQEYDYIVSFVTGDVSTSFGAKLGDPKTYLEARKFVGQTRTNTIHHKLAVNKARIHNFNRYGKRMDS